MPSSSPFTEKFGVNIQNQIILKLEKINLFKNDKNTLKKNANSKSNFKFKEVFYFTG